MGEAISAKPLPFASGSALQGVGYGQGYFRSQRSTNAMSTYWKMYWDEHVENVSGSDPFRQVLRVQNKQPLSEKLFVQIVSNILEKLELEANHSVLDLCCGNGLITTELAQHCSHVMGVDFCEDLVEGLKGRAPHNVTASVGDIVKIKFEPRTFHRILLAAALQHFSQAEVIHIFRNVMHWLQPGGIILITDILDDRRIWNFYNSQEREDAYFQNIREDTPILGTWFNQVWLEKLARHAGFSHIQICEQPEQFLYSHYRFDMTCRK